MATLGVRADAGVSIPHGWFSLVAPLGRGDLLGAVGMLARANLAFALPAALLVFVFSEPATWAVFQRTLATVAVLFNGNVPGLRLLHAWWRRSGKPQGLGAHLVLAALVLPALGFVVALPAHLVLRWLAPDALGSFARLAVTSALVALLYGLVFFTNEDHRRSAREAVARLESSCQKQRELEVARHRAEIATLEALIKPHFVFNALNGITTLIHEDPAKAEETALRLARLMRYLLEIRSGEMMSLESEMGVLKAYLEIERVRMGSRLAYEIDVPEDLRPIPVPALVLQPLMENAVRHGVWERGSGGFIRLRASRRGDGYEVEIIDNGPGFKPRQTSGHSLELVRDRLRRLYGGLYDLRLERDEDAGQTTATLHLPLALPRLGCAS